MITPDNHWQVIDAYLHGHLDEAGRAEVTQKLADDPEFRADYTLQLALHEQLDQQQQQADEALVDRLIAEWTADGMFSDPPPPPTKPASVEPTAPVRPLRQSAPFWQQTWVRAAAALLVIVGLGWLAYHQFAPDPTLTTAITYEQRTFGATGTPDAYRTTTYPVTFIADGTDPAEYVSDGTRLTLYVPDLPDVPTSWTLRDNPQTGNFFLTTPTGQRFSIDRNTQGQRRLLQP